MRAAVVGAGIYGATIAVELARQGHQVDLYDRHRDLLHGATRAQQARLHLGYHYPRSMATAQACKADAARFERRFPRAVNRRNTHYYAIADQGSLTSADDYLQFCEDLDAGGKVVAVPSWLAHVQVVVKVPEAIVNVVAVREQLRVELRQARVAWHRDTDINPDRLEHDLIVLATYGRGWPDPLRWEVCEVAQMVGASIYGFRSVVILDGPFCGLDPFPSRTGHLLYHVTESVHTAQVGDGPRIPKRMAQLIDAGPMLAAATRYRPMLAAARRFFPLLGADVAYDGSLFTVRAVLPDVDATDARPTRIRHTGRTIAVLSGKIDGAPAAAERVAALAGAVVGV